MSRFHVSLPGSRIKKMEAEEVRDALREAALEQIDGRDVDGLAKYLEPLFPQTELANWAKEKFSIDVSPKEFVADGARGAQPLPAEEVIGLIEGRARDAYSRREIEYPVEHLLTYAFGDPSGGGVNNPYAADFVRSWAKGKYDIDLPVERIQELGVSGLRVELRALQEKWLSAAQIG